MSLRTVVMIFCLAIAILFTAVNWQALSAVSTVNLIYTEIKFPLGLAVICVFGALWVVTLLWGLLQKASYLLEIRRAHKNAEDAKRLAQNAEDSRIDAMRKALESEISKVAAQQDAIRKEEIKSFREDLEAIKKSVESLQGEVITLTSSMGTLSSSMGTLSSEVAKAVPQVAETVNELSKEPGEEPKKKFLGLF